MTAAELGVVVLAGFAGGLAASWRAWRPRPTPGSSPYRVLAVDLAGAAYRADQRARDYTKYGARAEDVVPDVRRILGEALANYEQASSVLEAAALWEPDC